jgi:hypothetical protein
MSDRKPCAYCEDEPEPGWIEMPNNGPVVPCPMCNRDEPYEGEA